MSWISDKLGGKASARMAAPLARTSDLVVEDLSDEVLIYDQQSNQAHCLSRDAAMVWRVCDGATAPAALATSLGLSPESVDAALDQLEAAGLLETVPAPGFTRREATIRMAKVGGAVAAAPMIYSIVAPAPALAHSQHYCESLSGGSNGCSRGTSTCQTCTDNGCVCCGDSTAAYCTSDCSSCSWSSVQQRSGENCGSKTTNPCNTSCSSKSGNGW